MPGMRHVGFATAVALSPPLCLLLALGCTQGAATRSAHQVLASVVLAGGARSPSSAAPTARRVLGTAEEYLGVP
jgi:hypothetical protein